MEQIDMETIEFYPGTSKKRPQEVPLIIVINKRVALACSFPTNIELRKKWMNVIK